MAVKKPPAPAAARRKPRRDTAAAARRDGRAPGAGLSFVTPVVEYAIAAIVLVSLVFLWREASNIVLATDECFHAYVSRWIATHAALPRVIPELYSGMPYFYPPLLHLMGAAAFRIAGPDAFLYFNVILLGLLLAALFLVPGETRTARRWTAGLLVANGSMALYAVRFYAETLATVLAVATVLLLLRFWARPRPLLAAALGAAAGLGVLAKQPGVLLPALFALLAAIDLARGERRRAAHLALALGVSIAIALPWFVRNAMLFGSPFYPPVTSEAQRALDALNTHVFSEAPFTFYRSAFDMAGPVIPLLTLAALVDGGVRRAWSLRLGLLALCAGFVIAAPFIPRFEARHLNPFLAVAALLAGLWLADRLRGRRMLATGVSVLVVVWAVLAFPAGIHYRERLNQSPNLHEGYRAVRDHVPRGARVLCLWTYDAFYESGRPATWPIPWAPSAELLPLFTTHDPRVFLATLERQHVDYLLVPLGKPEPQFTGTNFNQSFIDCLVPLIDAHRLKIEWNSPFLAVVSRVR
jgi:hypothetical protein